MAEVSKETLRKEIAALLKGADLSKTSSKKVRQELEKKLDTDLDDRKKEIDTLVMDAIKKAKATKKNGKGDSDDEGNDDAEVDEEEDEDEDEEEEEVVKPAKKAAAVVKRKKADTSDESAGSDDDDGDKDDGDYSPKKGAPSKKKAPANKRGRKKKDDSDSDEDWKGAKKGKKGGGAKRAGSGYTKSITLSPELASLMGSESLPRHEVVKKMWAIIKERNLYDPTNKQYAICDDDLMKVIGVKRFRTFGMMKFLKNHFIS